MHTILNLSRIQSRRLPLLLLVVIAALLTACGTAPADLAATSENGLSETAAYPNAALLLEPDGVEALSGNPGVIILDVRDADSYVAGHIPGAVWFDTAALVDQGHAVAGHLRPADELGDYLSSLGISNDHQVIVYGDGTRASIMAARVFYALEYLGLHDQAALLNGGYQAWTAAGLSVSTEVPDIEPAVFQPNVREDLIASIDYIMDNLDNPDVIFWDARSTGEYTGEDVRAAEGGHIPGAVHGEWSLACDVSGDARQWLSLDELSAWIDSIGLDPDKEIVPYCQTNVRGAHAYFTLRLLGYERIRPYEGSWAEWGNETGVPIEKQS